MTKVLLSAIVAILFTALIRVFLEFLHVDLTTWTLLLVGVFYVAMNHLVWGDEE